jgi:AraC-like DNA-binding protein
MTTRERRSNEPSADRSETGPQVRSIARRRDWSIVEYVCAAGPGDRSFEERHDAFIIAAVVEGTFRYKSDTGTWLMHPGSWLLGNHGACFACGHDHSRGDRCISVRISPFLFAEVSASRGATGRFRFKSSLLPAGRSGLSLLGRVRSIAVRPHGLEIDETVTEIIETVISETSGEPPSCQRVSARDERRISGVLHQLEDRFPEALNLDDLAAEAAMSKYHFLRTFRSVVGRSPHQYLLGLRLQHVAQRLTSSSRAITEIALTCGFGDLSTFVSQFKRQYGETPSRYRARHRG